MTLSVSFCHSRVFSEVSLIRSHAESHSFNVVIIVASSYDNIIMLFLSLDPEWS